MSIIFDPEEARGKDLQAIEDGRTNNRCPILQMLDDEHEEWKLKKLNKPKKNMKCFFLTIQDFQRGMDDFDNMVKFINNAKYCFKDLLYVLESGKDANAPHLHFHLIGNYVNSKKGKSKVCLEWKKIFGNNLKDKDYWDLKQWNKS